MRAEYCSLPPEWREMYLAGLGKKDAEAVIPAKYHDHAPFHHHRLPP